MSRLGHEKFYIHGSDWGGITATTLATMFPQHVMGFHSNFCLSLQRKTLVRYLIGALWPSLFAEEDAIKIIYPPLKFMSFILGESAYFHLFATKPDTIGKFNYIGWSENLKTSFKFFNIQVKDKNSFIVIKNQSP